MIWWMTIAAIACARAGVQCFIATEFGLGIAFLGFCIGYCGLALMYGGIQP